MTSDIIRSLLRQQKSNLEIQLGLLEKIESALSAGNGGEGEFARLAKRYGLDRWSITALDGAFKSLSEQGENRFGGLRATVMDSAHSEVFSPIQTQMTQEKAKANLLDQVLDEAVNDDDVQQQFVSSQKRPTPSIKLSNSMLDEVTTSEKPVVQYESSLNDMSSVLDSPDIPEQFISAARKSSETPSPSPASTSIPPSPKVSSQLDLGMMAGQVATTPAIEEGGEEDTPGGLNYGVVSNDDFPKDNESPFK